MKRRLCPTCGTSLFERSERCPVCLLSAAIGEGQSGSPEEPELSDLRFENYRVFTGVDGKPLELGRGAMGVTYKALDLDLRRPVALKVINSHYLNNEDARTRFVREARSAASLHSPNVAGILRLGRTGKDYFYAMEFIQGETLQQLLKRRGCVDTATALEIIAQTANGLKAIQRQQLVHRDIKPANIMICLEEGKIESVKIIDLGLAKPSTESTSGISLPGSFAGTPEYASPEQFSGAGADIRSDLYSLGTTLWEMALGDLPFEGSVPDLIHQHQHTPVPLNKLAGIAQPVAALLEVLLQKDPSARFQTPSELITAVDLVKQAIDAGHTITAEELRSNTPAAVPSRLRNKSRKATGIAVLPFESFSANQDDVYFADGVHDELLNNLARIADLKVISRTSVIQYRADHARNLREIATALGVSAIVEGTFRRHANRIRMSAKLIDAPNDQTIWADSYDRELTDIFDVQSEIAQTVAHKLAAALSPSEKELISQTPTDSVGAYDLYLQAKALIAGWQGGFNFVGTGESLHQAIELLNQAIRIDPSFTLAYCAATFASDILYCIFDPARERLVFGDKAVEDALRLQPQLPEAHLNYARHLYICYRDYDGARVELEIARAGLPNNSDVLYLQAAIERREGRFENAIEALRAAIASDPRNPSLIMHLAFIHSLVRQFGAAADVFDKGISALPEHWQLKLEKAFYVTFLKTGQLADFDAAIAELPPGIAKSRSFLNRELKVAVRVGNWARVRSVLDQLIKDGAHSVDGFVYDESSTMPPGCYAILLARLQRHDVSTPEFKLTRDEYRKIVESYEGNASYLSSLAVLDALLGRKAAALKEAADALEKLPISKDATYGPLILINSAIVDTWTGQIDQAFTKLDTLIKIPAGIYYGQLKLDPLWDPLRNDPRFSKLLAELARQVA
jgi:serine/threonine protein kinase/tetratricopeptide (TPR) repeat protein